MLQGASGKAKKEGESTQKKQRGEAHWLEVREESI